MALQTHPWVNDRWLAEPPPISASPTFPATLVLDATADRIVFAGRFVHKDRVAKTVDGAGFLLGALVKAGGSTLQFSLQDVDLTAGPPIREDGTPDQVMSIANADAGFVTNAWYEAGFDGAATRSLTPGDLVAGVLQLPTWFAGDSVIIRAVAAISNVTGLITQQGAVVTNLSGSYALHGSLPNMALRCSDGTYGTIEGAFVCSALNTHQFHLNTAGADEYALAFQWPYPCAVDGLWASVSVGTAGDVSELLLYSGTTALATVSLDHNAVASALGRTAQPFAASQALAANTLYRVAIRPTGTNVITVYSFDVAMANHLQCHPGGVNAHLWTRVDQGAWEGEVTTRRLFAGIRPSAFDDGVGGGGTIYHGAMAGGLIS